MVLSESQILISAKYLAASNTGLLGMIVSHPSNIRGIEKAFSIIDAEYCREIGMGIGGDRKFFIKQLKRGEYLDTIKKNIPFILEETK